MKLRSIIFNLLLALGLCCPVTSMAQQSKLDSLIRENRFKLEFRTDFGNVMPTNTFVRFQNTDPDGLAHYFGTAVRIARQTTGTQLWQQLYDYPEYGIGFYSAQFRNTPNLGNPFAFYGFFNAPFFRINKISLNYELGLGFAFGWKHYDPLANPGNIAIGADGSVYIDAGAELRYDIGKRFGLSVGYGFTHFSNGRIKLPNKGLNTGAAKVMLAYHLFREPVYSQKLERPRFKSRYEWIISAYGGIQNVVYLGADVDIVTGMKGINLPVYGISNTLNRQISYKSKIGFGLTVGYNGSQNSQIIVEGGKLDEMESSFARDLSLSIYPSYELVIDRLSVLVQPGIYIYRRQTANMSQELYQRIGIKYHFLKNTFFGISLRAEKLYISDFIEWTIGQRLCW